MINNLKSIKAIMLYEFKNIQLLHDALIHPSKEKNFTFQRLEFLGDKVLNFNVCEQIYKIFPHKNEGELSILLAHLISTNTINHLVKVHIETYIQYTGELNASIVADTFEAIIGAIYLDGGNTKNIIITLWEDYINNNYYKDFKNPKNILQESIHKEANYNIKESYINNKKRFLVEISNNGVKSEATGKSKKEATTNCAIDLLKKLSDQ
jgi:ribonuclease-3